ncbi:hypothetical protein [Pseudomonas sp.]|uniref:hypothetical protein n=1 Tax=Pseudomonas sp. TaxID=306 RepID=UPI003FD8ACC2
MRVPIFSKDLESGKGVLRLARCLQRDWPSEEPIKLSAAQNLMSRCLGYVDFHDVKVSADSANSVFPSLEDVQAQSCAVIKAELAKYSQPVEISGEDLYVRISKWPFMHLHAFHMRSGEPGVKLSEEALLMSEKAALYYALSVPKLELDEIDVQAIFERVRSAMGHNPKELTLSYLKTPIGQCRSSDDTPEASVFFTKCFDCGPASVDRLKQNSSES